MPKSVQNQPPTVSMKRNTKLKGENVVVMVDNAKASERKKMREKEVVTNPHYTYIYIHLRSPFYYIILLL
jgi:hypothetical protein